MEPIHIFFRGLLLNENNIFTANLAESKEYAISGLSINQDIDSDLVAVAKVDNKEAISNLI